MSSEKASSDEKMGSCHRRRRLLTRRWDHVVGEGVFRREDGIMSSEKASSDEKMGSGHRRRRLLTRSWAHVVGTKTPGIYNQGCLVLNSLYEWEPPADLIWAFLLYDALNLSFNFSRSG